MTFPQPWVLHILFIECQYCSILSFAVSVALEFRCSRISFNGLTVCAMTRSSNTLLTVTSLLFAAILALPPLFGPIPPTPNPGSLWLATNQRNTTTSPLVLGNTDPSINCDGAKYRTGLKIASCQDAFEQIPRDEGTLRFALQGNYDVQLPYRFISGEFSKRRLLVPYCA